MTQYIRIAYVDSTHKTGPRLFIFSNVIVSNNLLFSQEIID